MSHQEVIPVFDAFFYSSSEKGKDEKSSTSASEESNEDSKNKKPKKRVSWAAEKNLIDIKYFELDETERGWSCWNFNWNLVLETKTAVSNERAKSQDACILSLELWDGMTVVNCLPCQ